MIEYKTASLRKWLYFVGVVVLFTGLGSAALIYRSSGDYPRSGQIYEDGYAVSPEDTKQYLRGLELYGGTANVLADEFNRWFEGLWQGKSLATTIACITIFISSVIFYISYHLRER